MRTLSKLVVATLAGITVAGAASTFAHGPGYGPGGGYGPRGHGSGAWMMGRYGGGPGAGPCVGVGGSGTRLEALKDELKLTAEQTKAWAAFEQAIAEQRQFMIERHAGWSQNADEHIAFMERRLAGMKAVQQARKELYSVLTPEQKAIADRLGFSGPRG
jgi:Spy/CpxP family protein refolding chaperone